jgi:L-asparaginase II
MLDAIDATASDLQCGCHVPYYFSYTGRESPGGVRWSTLHHNCSGKHAGFLAACRLHGEPLADYLAPDSPLQTRIRNRLRDFCGGGPLVPGIDGCSAPNYAMPLDRLAHAFCRLALGETPALAAPRFAMTLKTAVTQAPPALAAVLAGRSVRRCAGRCRPAGGASGPTSATAPQRP